MDTHFDDTRQIASRSFEDCRHIGKFEAGLRFNIAQFELLRRRIDGSLSRDEDKPAGDYRM
jgi:hypothetical protein